ncbi:MAG TPA: AMP-binding protein [Acidimicrobiales bacterium]|nr:AMP-binding protein [Acidimicrobiales bacterium]
MDLIPQLGAAASLTVAGRTLDGEGLAGAAAAVARRVAGMPALAVTADASLETVVAVVGGLMAGVPVVPVPPDAGPLERRHILTDSGAQPGPPVDVGERADFREPDLAPERTAMILYTSGTTGLPKGVMLSAAAIATDLDLLAAAWEWTGEDVLAHGLPLFHVHGLILGVLGPLRVGSPLVHTGRPTPDAYAGAGGSLYFGVPTVWSRVADTPDAAAALRPARLLVSGSAGLPVPVFEKLRRLAGQGPIERYGMTETLITVSGSPAGERRPGWVGRPLPGVATRLVDDGGAPVPADGESVGSLQVRTPTFMSGYLNRAEASAEMVTADGWVRTGDVACIDPAGWHRIVGRESVDLIKSGGYRIGAGEVEAALLAHPAVGEAAVVGQPDDDLGQVIVAYVVARDRVTGSELTEFVASTLSVHKRPRRVEVVDSLPRNAMGKVQKNLLLDR